MKLSELPKRNIRLLDKHITGKSERAAAETRRSKYNFSKRFAPIRAEMRAIDNRRFDTWCVYKVK